MLTFPKSDVPLALMTDASNFSIGGVLQQFIGNSWKPLGFFSKHLSETQRRYSTYDRELLAIYLAMKYFRKMFEGRPLTIYTDHRPLEHVFKKVGTSSETPRRTRQILFISEFTTDIRHVGGNDNVVADALSRVATISCPTSIDYKALAQAQNADDYVTSNVLGSKLKRIHIPTCNEDIYCEMSTSKARPYLPIDFRKVAFNSIHDLSHPGSKVTRKLVTERYFWPDMNRDIGIWAKTCVHCQRAKVNRHTASQHGTFPNVERFEHVHIDIIGPLPITPNGDRYCVTVVDRYTRWPEAFPIADITADTVARVFYEGWITRYGCPIRITTDQGRQFESSLFRELLRYLGVQRIRTTPYHPQSNGLVERFHRTLKTALTARLNSASWINELPTVLYGLRAAGRSDSGVSASELTFGRTLRLPGDFFDFSDNDTISDPNEVVENIRRTLSQLKSVKKSHKNLNSFFVHPDLETCEYVFVRDDTVRRPLKAPYDGPFRVITRNKKVYQLQLSNRQTYISVDRLKPAYVLSDQPHERISVPASTEDRSVSIKPTNSVPDCPSQARKTRSGRLVRQPVRFA